MKISKINKIKKSTHTWMSAQ